MFSLELPYRGNSNECTQYSIFNINTKIKPLYCLITAPLVFFQGTQERVQNSHCKQAISVRAIEVVLYVTHIFLFADNDQAPAKTS